MRNYFKAEKCDDPVDQFVANCKRNTRIIGAAAAAALLVVGAAKFNQKLNEWP